MLKKSLFSFCILYILGSVLYAAPQTVTGDIPFIHGPLGVTWGMTVSQAAQILSLNTYDLSFRRLPQDTDLLTVSVHPDMALFDVKLHGVKLPIPIERVVLEFYRQRLMGMQLWGPGHPQALRVNPEFGYLQEQASRVYVLDKIQNNLYAPLPNVYFSNPAVIGILSSAFEQRYDDELGREVKMYFWHLQYRYRALDPHLNQAISDSFHPPERYKDLDPQARHIFP